MEGVLKKGYQTKLELWKLLNVMTSARDALLEEVHIIEEQKEGIRWNLGEANDRIKKLEEALISQSILIESLDEAMATPERIALDTKAVGGFISGLDLTETAEQIILRARNYILQSKKEET